MTAVTLIQECHQNELQSRHSRESRLTEASCFHDCMYNIITLYMYVRNTGL